MYGSEVNRRVWDITVGEARVKMEQTGRQAKKEKRRKTH